MILLGLGGYEVKGRGLGKWGLNISRSVNILDKIDIILCFYGRFYGRFLRCCGVRRFEILGGKKMLRLGLVTILRNLYKNRD